MLLYETYDSIDDRNVTIRKGNEKRKRGYYIMKKGFKTLSAGLAICLAASSMMACGKTSTNGKVETQAESEVIDLKEHGIDVATLSAPGENAGIDTFLRKPETNLAGDGSDTTTIMIYMNGSNLESEGGYASEDISEILDAGYSDQVNILIQTMGTSEWKEYGIASDHSQIYKVEEDGITLVNDELDQLAVGETDTLSQFISWSAENYPADRYDLILWNHGGGPVIGFGEDETSGDDMPLFLYEMKNALIDANVHFDFIGFDACLMSGIETCCVLYDFCDYTILSEDFESGNGWYYTPWLEALYENPSIPTYELGKYVVDGLVDFNEDYQKEVDNELALYYLLGGDKMVIDSTLAVIDESWVPVLYATWVDFAYKNTDALLEANYSREEEENGRAIELKDYDTMLDYYYLTDIMAVAQNIESDESAALASAVANAIVYCRTSESDSYLTGLSVTLPYGDKDFCEIEQMLYKEAGFDAEYINWLGEFADAQGANDPYDWSDWDATWNGWVDFVNDYDWSQWQFLADPDFWNGLNINWSDSFSQNQLNHWMDTISHTIGGINVDDYAPVLSEYYNAFFGGSSSSSATSGDSFESDLTGTTFYYDEEEEVWYSYDEEEGLIYFYFDGDEGIYILEEDTDTLYFYDEEEDEMYIFDDEEDEWYYLG